jgi:hypothetical protein
MNLSDSPSRGERAPVVIHLAQPATSHPARSTGTAVERALAPRRDDRLSGVPPEIRTYVMRYLTPSESVELSNASQANRKARSCTPDRMLGDVFSAADELARRREALDLAIADLRFRRAAETRLRDQAHVVQERLNSDPHGESSCAGELLQTLGRYQDAELVLKWGIRMNTPGSLLARTCRLSLANLYLRRANYPAVHEQAALLGGNHSQAIQQAVELHKVFRGESNLDQVAEEIRLASVDPRHGFERYICTRQVELAIRHLRAMSPQGFAISAFDDLIGQVTSQFVPIDLADTDARWQQFLEILFMAPKDLQTISFVIPEVIAAPARAVSTE